MPQIIKTLTVNSHIQNAHEVIDIELAAIHEIKTNLGDSFSESVDLIINRIPPGKLIVMGMGKSGHIGKKIAASFASTGTPSFFVHPAEAGHGDLGMITKNDIVLTISQSGTSEEFNIIISYLKRNGIDMLSLCGNSSSLLAKSSKHSINTKISNEACPLGLAPTASSTVALVIGDALVMTCMQARGFDSNDYARTHPHGALGRKLLLRISDVMSVNNDIPSIDSKDNLSEALLTITSKGMGFGIVEDGKKVVGVFTDGDLRRSLESGQNINSIKIEDVMTKEFSYINSSELAVHGVRLMEQKKISSLPVINDGLLIGAVNMRQLLQSGVI